MCFKKSFIDAYFARSIKKKTKTTTMKQQTNKKQIEEEKSAFCYR